MRGITRYWPAEPSACSSFSRLIHLGRITVATQPSISHQVTEDLAGPMGS